MFRRTFLGSALMGAAARAAAQDPVDRIPHPLPGPDNETRLPNGKLQRDEILKAEHQKSLQDAADMERLCEELHAELEKATAFVVPLQTVKKTEEIEKLARRIRGRLKRG